MQSSVKNLIICVFLSLAGKTGAQGVSLADTLTIPGTYKPAQNRQLWHDRIDQEQKSILAGDGIEDNSLTPSKDDDVNYLLTRSQVKN